MKKNGFTLIETLISLSILGGVSVAGMQYVADEREKEISYSLIKNVNDIINAVDSRILIDGYDPDLWNKLSWNNENEIIDDLVKKDLQTSSNCTGGLWNPTVNAESETILLPCNFSLNAESLDIDMSANIKNDSSGFIQKFDIILNFKNDQSLTDNLINLRSAMHTIDAHEKRENSGTHSMYFVSKTDNDKEITSFECINNISDCSIKASYDRSGGNEYLRADGANSIIGENITFIESKGQAPMKCIRWANTDRAGTGTWTQKLDEECGIGIYKNDPNPVMVDVVVDTGTFKNILLDQECKIYSWNGATVVDSGVTSPCGTNHSTGDIYQVVDNISSFNLSAVNVYGDTSNFALANINKIVADTIDVNHINVLNNLKTDLITSYSGGAVQLDGTLNLRDMLNVGIDLTVGNNINANGDISSLGSVISNDILEIKKINVADSSCSVNGSLSVDTNGGLLSCESGSWISLTKDKSPIGTVAMWASYSLPSGWIEMNGQSTAPYPKLRAVVGNNVPDMRGVVARGLDNGRGLDSGRSLASYQGDTMQRITGTFESRSHRQRTNYISGAFTAGSGLSKDDGWDGWVSSQRIVNFDSARQTRTSDETRMENVSLIYIIKAN